MDEPTNIPTEQSTKQKNKRTLMLQAVTFVVFFALAFFGTKFLFRKDIGDELQKVSTEMNKTLPMKVDDDTRLDNTQFIAPRTIQYNYTVVALDSDSMTMDLDGLKKFAMEQTQKQLDTAPEMKLFRENDVTMKYNYKDKKGKYLLDFSISPTKK